MKKHFFVRGPIAAALFLTVLILCLWPRTKAHAGANWQSGATLQPLILSNVTVIDGRGGKPRPGQTVVIRNGKIEQIIATRRAVLPKGATVLDLAGHYVIPGLIDSHVHLPADRQKLKQQLEFLFDGGITTVRDMGGDAALYAQLAPLSRQGSSLLPRLYYSAYWAGPSFWAVDKRWEGATQDKRPGEVPWALSITDSTDLVAAVRDAKAIGATAIKIYSDLSPQLVRRITAEAHRQGLKVWSHPAIFPVRPSDVAKSGVDVISHSALLVWEGVDVLPARFHTKPWTDFGPVGPYASVPFDSPQIVRLLGLMRRRGIILDPTISTISISISPAAAEWSFKVTALANRMGVSITAGTDRDDSTTKDGYPTLFEEVEALVTKCGFTPLEAITAATRNGARSLGTDTLFGTVEPGKLADLLVLQSDPTTDIRNLRQIAYVIKEGNLHRPSRVMR